MALVEINANQAALSPWFVHKMHALLTVRGWRDKHGPYSVVMGPERAEEWGEVMPPELQNFFSVTVIPPKEIDHEDGTKEIIRFPADVIEFHCENRPELGKLYNLGPIGEQHA